MADGAVCLAARVVLAIKPESIATLVDMGQSASRAIVVHSIHLLSERFIMMTNTFRTASFVPTALALGASNLPANARPFGPGPGGMMGGGWDWGWGMGGFAGICLLAVALLGLGLAFLAVRRRNS